eukprot:UN04000
MLNDHCYFRNVHDICKVRCSEGYVHYDARTNSIEEKGFLISYKCSAGGLWSPVEDISLLCVSDTNKEMNLLNKFISSDNA